jgi:hypothetical protein
MDLFSLYMGLVFGQKKILNALCYCYNLFNIYRCVPLLMLYLSQFQHINKKCDTPLDAVFHNSEVSTWCISVFSIMQNVTDIAYKLLFKLLFNMIQ